MEYYSNIIFFIKEIERLKNITRTAWTSEGRHESVAEHSWRLSMFMLVLEDFFPEIDFNKVLCMALIHDLGEAYEGDVSATIAVDPMEKLKKEKAALERMVSPLNFKTKQKLMGLWNEYNECETKEAKMVKSLDKMETIIQHNQGLNPTDFDYYFNLDYGKNYAQFDPIIAALRELIDKETSERMEKEK